MVTSAAIGKLKSSIIPRVNAAEKPMTAHINGTIRIALGYFSSNSKNIPKVNIVVGQGSPNVGAAGYRCPKK